MLVSSVRSGKTLHLGGVLCTLHKHFTQATSVLLLSGMAADLIENVQPEYTWLGLPGVLSLVMADLSVHHWRMAWAEACLMHK